MGTLYIPLVKQHGLAFPAQNMVVMSLKKMQMSVDDIRLFFEEVNTLLAL
jgi:hypothetical protein